MNSQKFAALKKMALVLKNGSLDVRVQYLKNILSWIEKNESRITEALFKDFQKSDFETQVSEISVVKSELKFFIKKTKSKAKKVSTPLTLLGHTSRIRYEGKGAVLIISPWNYPFNLAITPLIPALAAGNTVVIKPSELTPHTSDLIKAMMAELFSEDVVCVELGDKDKSTELLTYDFDHVFFTGSTQVGRIVATACAQKLIPYTLELGGKSPTIIDETANIQQAAEKIYWGKFLNRGQTCIAPDYILIHHSKKTEFLKAFAQIEKQNSEKPTGFINSFHENRVTKLVPSEVNFAKVSCELIDSPDLNSDIMKTEIFGPIAPVIGYQSLDEVYKIMALNPHPLALYIFSKSKTTIDAILNQTQSGDVAINNVLLHFANHNLPFGGIRTSGIGSYHGHNGFLEFSHQRSVIEQKFFAISMKMVFPPYTNFKKKLLKYV